MGSLKQKTNQEKSNTFTIWTKSALIKPNISHSQYLVLIFWDLWWIPLPSLPTLLRRMASITFKHWGWVEVGPCSHVIFSNLGGFPHLADHPSAFVSICQNPLYCEHFSIWRNEGFSFVCLIARFICTRTATFAATARQSRTTAHPGTWKMVGQIFFLWNWMMRMVPKKQYWEKKRWQCSHSLRMDQYQQAVIQDWHKRHREITYSRKRIGTRENHKCSEENERRWAVPVPLTMTIILTMDQYHWSCWTSFPPCSSSCLMCLITRGDPSPLAVT